MYFYLKFDFLIISNETDVHGSGIGDDNSALSGLVIILLSSWAWNKLLERKDWHGEGSGWDSLHGLIIGKFSGENNKFLELTLGADGNVDGSGVSSSDSGGTIEIGVAVLDTGSLLSSSELLQHFYFLF